ncbi:MAG: hypothetical protein U0736_00925 [Gemmataceae bacterium]
MTRLTRLPAALAVGTVAVILLTGCPSGGPKNVPIKGKLVDNGQPVKAAAKLPPGDPGMRVEFITVKGGVAGEPYGASVNAGEGTFTVPGPKGKGIPPGQYKVSVHVGAFGAPDALKGAFIPEKTPLTVDIPDKPAVNVTVDVGKKAVTVD